MADDFGVMLGKALVIDDHVIVFGTTECQAIRERNLLLSVFKNECELGHGFMPLRRNQSRINRFFG
jgi:hypothetical protein